MNPAKQKVPTAARARRAWSLALALAVALGSSGCASALTSGRPAHDVPLLQPFQIRTVQRELQVRGYPVEATGIWDEATQSSVAEYQAARGLPRTGQPDLATLFRLGVDPDPRFNCEVNNSMDCGPQGGP